MIPTFPYMAMTITGILHCGFGLTIFINACVGLNMDLGIGRSHDYSFDSGKYHYNHNEYVQQVIRIYLGVVVGSAIWIIMVGVLGILTGVKRENHQRTNGLKIAYMVTAILSAVLFSLAGVSLSALVKKNYQSIGLVGSIASFADFVLAIVSSSICCCCSSTVTNTAGVVYVQNYAPQAETHPPGTYPPGTYPPATYPPATYPPANYPPGTYPPGAYPPAYTAAPQSYTVLQSPQDGITNPGYHVNPNLAENQTKNMMA